MMNREQMLQWLVKNVTAWDFEEFKASIPKGWVNPKGWDIKYEASIGFVFVSEKEIVISEKDWLAAKQPSPLTRDQALAWLVENVKVWPCGIDAAGAATNTCPEWIWIKTPGNWVFSSGNGDYIDNHDLEEWQAAQPAPASNKPSWDDAPEDAKIRVQDQRGSFHFGTYNSADTTENGKWFGIGKGKWFGTTWEDSHNPNWRDTLEYRPVADDSTPVDMRQVNGIDAGVELDTHVHGNVDPSQEEKRDAVLAQLSKNLIRTKELKSSIALTEISLDLMLQEQDKLSRDISDILLHFGY